MDPHAASNLSPTTFVDDQEICANFNRQGDGFGLAAVQLSFERPDENAILGKCRSKPFGFSQLSGTRPIRIGSRDLFVN